MHHDDSGSLGGDGEVMRRDGGDRACGCERGGIPRDWEDTRLAVVETLSIRANLGMGAVCDLRASLLRRKLTLENSTCAVRVGVEHGTDWFGWGFHVRRRGCRSD